MEENKDIENSTEYLMDDFPDETKNEQEKEPMEIVELEDTNVEPMKDPEIMEEEKPKRKMKRGTLPKLLLSFLLFAAGIYLIVISVRYEEPTDEPVANNTETNETNETNESTVDDAKVYLALVPMAGNLTVEDYQILILKPDNTFIYNNTVGAPFYPLVGTYTIDNEFINLEVTAKYGSDECYFVENWNKKYSGNYKEDTINIDMDDEKLEFKLDNDYQIGKYNIQNYKVNPSDGDPIDGTNDTWTNCDNFEN